MYKKLANLLTELFLSKNLILEDKKEIYLYGFELIASMIVYAIIFLFCALITSTLYTSIVFFLGFYLVRKFCGGFHANTHLMCNFMTTFTHLIAIAFLLWFPSLYRNIFNTITLLCCALLILLFAPVDHKNKKFIKNEYQNFKIKSCIYSCFILVIAIFNIIEIHLLIHKDIFIFAYSLGTLSATISMLSAKIINLNERRKVI